MEHANGEIVQNGKVADHGEIVQNGKVADHGEIVQNGKIADHGEHVANGEPPMTNGTTTSLSKEKTELNEKQYPIKIVWRNTIFFVYLHIFAVIGLYYLVSFSLKWQTYIWSFIVLWCNWHGITVGAHRLWTHRAYKAKLPLRMFLCMCNCVAFQNHIYEWSRDHRTHHKFSETNADPHNAKRGFFFSHMGWLMCRKHPDVFTKGKTIDLSDLEADPVVRFQRTFYVPLTVVFCYVLPMIIPYYLYGEDLYRAFCSVVAFRLCYTFHCTWLVNSAAHLWGDKPYDKSINPVENDYVRWFTAGEGFHNFHHTFPWDYAASEWGTKKNLSTYYIDVYASWGLAYDLKKAPTDVVANRRNVKGDGSKPWYSTEEEKTE